MRILQQIYQRKGAAGEIEIWLGYVMAVIAFGVFINQREFGC